MSDLWTSQSIHFQFRFYLKSHMFYIIRVPKNMAKPEALCNISKHTNQIPCHRGIAHPPLADGEA